MKKILLSILLIFSCLIVVNAQENYSLSGYVKGLSSIQFTNVSKTFVENTIHNRFDFNWYATNKVTITAGLRNRFIFGSSINQFPNYASYLGEDSGFLNLTDVWLNKNATIGITQIDRLFIDYTSGKFEVTVGRQRINWGQAFVWNPSDLFNTYSYFDFDYEEKPGSDAIRMQYYLSETSKLELTTTVDIHKKMTSALLYKWNAHKYDFQLLTGIFSQTDWVLGAGWSGSILGGGFNGEVTYFHSIDSSKNSNKFTAVVHYDYIFKNSLSLQFEMLYNGFGSNNSSNSLESFTLMRLNAKNLFPAKTAFFGSVSYPISPLFTALFSSIIAQSGALVYVGPTLTYSLSNNKELAIVGQFYQLKNRTLINGGAVFARLKWSF
ncbi:MAG: hypothetical protein ACWA42_09900 [Lutibacter sp.]